MWEISADYHRNALNSMAFTIQFLNFASQYPHFWMLAGTGSDVIR
jgi:hypothetical protein